MNLSYYKIYWLLIKDKNFWFYQKFTILFFILFLILNGSAWYLDFRTIFHTYFWDFYQSNCKVLALFLYAFAIASLNFPPLLVLAISSWGFIQLVKQPIHPKLFSNLYAKNNGKKILNSLTDEIVYFNRLLLLPFEMDLKNMEERLNQQEQICITIKEENKQIFLKRKQLLGLP